MVNYDGLDSRGSVIHTDVLVVGGGTAGCIAAIAAAEEGAGVILLERDYALGGVGVRGGVHLYWYGSRGGLQDRIDRLAEELAQSFCALSVGFHPEAKRAAISRMIMEQGVDVRFGAFVYEVLMNRDTVRGVKAQTENGSIEVHAKVLIDATGDADVVAAAGGDWQSGREEDGLTHCYSLVPRVVMQDGRVHHMNFDAGWVEADDPWDVSRAYALGRQHIREILDEESAAEPSFDHMISIAPQIGIRESRRIKGAYTVTFDDLLQNRTFADTVCGCFTHYDNHASDLANESIMSQIYTIVLSLNRQSLRCGIPLRAMLPKQLNGIIVAGRSISLDRDAAMGIRMQRDMHKLGEAAGVAAALCSKSGIDPKRTDIAQLQRRLIERGVLRPEELDARPNPNLQLRNRPVMAEVEGKGEGSSSAESLMEELRNPDNKNWGVALWQLWQSGRHAEGVLLRMLKDERLTDKLGAVYGLALLKHESSVPYLIEMIAARDPAVLNATKKSPRWVAGLILLRHMRSSAGLSESLNILHESHEPRIYAYVLQYLREIADILNPDEKRRTAGKILAWTRLPLPDNKLKMHGDRKAPFRWNLELNAAILLRKLELGEAAAEICRKHMEADEAYVRKAARLIFRKHIKPEEDLT